MHGVRRTAAFLVSTLPSCLLASGSVHRFASLLTPLAIRIQCRVHCSTRKLSPLSHSNSICRLAEALFHIELHAQRHRSNEFVLAFLFHLLLRTRHALSGMRAKDGGYMRRSGRGVGGASWRPARSQRAEQRG